MWKCGCYVTMVFVILTSACQFVFFSPGPAARVQRMGWCRIARWRFEIDGVWQFQWSSCWQKTQLQLGRLCRQRCIILEIRSSQHSPTEANKILAWNEMPEEERKMQVVAESWWWWWPTTGRGSRLFYEMLLLIQTCKAIIDGITCVILVPLCTAKTKRA